MKVKRQKFDDKLFIWPSHLAKKMFELRYQNDWLFKKKRQPWGEFHKILIENGFPEEITVGHVRKKWSYHLDTYKLAKRNNKICNYYKIFDKIYRESKTLDKYESWSDEWRLKLITVLSETKGLGLDYQTLWRTIERAMRCQELPVDCCVQDMKGLWQHIRMTFNRKHRLKMKKGAELTEWALYDAMLSYYQKVEPEYLINLETHVAPTFFRMQQKTKLLRKKKDLNRRESEGEFQWSKHITESFIQVRLQNDWLFREKKCAWKDLLGIMIQEYDFPKTLTSREICRKWASTMSDYQKAKATNNKTWVYYNLFELYLGEGSLTLNPIVSWQEEWVFNLISARTDLEHMFKDTLKQQADGWREVEKRLRGIGLPLDHSLLDLPAIWSHLLKTFKWKQKFANKGILTEHWPYFEAMTRYTEIQIKPERKRKREVNDDHHLDDGHDADDDDFDDDIKLFDLKQKLQLVKPKYEVDSNHCRCCANEDGCVNIFVQKDDEGIDVAYKLKIVGGVEVEKSDSLPPQICFNCLEELENAYKFRRKCQEVDKQFRVTKQTIKVERNENVENEGQNNNDEDGEDRNDFDDSDTHFDTPVEFEAKLEDKPKVKKEVVRKKRGRKMRYDYYKMCEVCGKNTRNLSSHMDMHTKDKAYSCDVCEKKFKFKAGLLIHKAVHNPVPRKTCEVCGKTFHILAQYRKHFVYHANERKFECETCGKRFNSMDILRVHTRTHTDERPFSCSECGKTFRTAGCVSRHKRIVHKGIKKVPAVQ